MNKDDYKVDVEQLLYSYYIKYNRLLDITNVAFKDADPNSRSISIYIDLYDMLKPLYTTNIYANKQLLIVSSVINLAAHMRHYFWSRHRLNTKIYLVYGENITDNHTCYYNGFGSDDTKSLLHYDKIKSVIESQLEMIKILCAYIYDVYLIRKQTDFSMFTYSNIKINPQENAVIITKSKYAIQIPALCPNAVIYRPKKSNGVDVSYFINHNNSLGMMFNKIQSKETYNKLLTINPKLLSVLLTMNGLPSCRLLTLMNITSSVNRLYKGIQEGKIINDYNTDIMYVHKALNLHDKIDVDNFKYRFYAVDLQFQHIMYYNSLEAKDFTWKINLNDPSNIKYINDKYFVNNPLDLQSLSEVM